MNTSNLDLQKIKAIDIKKVIESESNISFRKNRGSFCPFCNSGNHNSRNSDSAFNINPQKNTFKCFSCGKGSSVIDFIMTLKKIGYKQALEYLRENYLEGTVSTTPFPTVKPPIQQVKFKAIEYIPDAIFKQTLVKAESNFHQYLSTLFQNERHRSNVQSLYQLGSYENGKVVFWQIDDKGMVRTGKIMQYNPLTGRRDRSIKPSWIHYEKGFKNTKCCFFGEHLLPSSKKPVGIVESEATAVVASQYLQDFTWIATGGKNNLENLLRGCYSLNMRKKKIILFPDLSENMATFLEWREIGEEFRERKYNITTSSALEDLGVSLEDRRAGYDLRDYLVKENIK